MNTYTETNFKDSEIGKIPKDWEVKELGEITLKITDGTHSTVKDNPNGKNYLLSCKNIKNGKIILGNKERLIDDETLINLRKRTNLQKNDLLLTTVGTIGETSLIKLKKIDFELQRSVAIIRPNLDLINEIYLYQNSKCYIFQHQAKGSARGSVQTCLFLREINKIKIPLPPTIQEQKAIAKILSDLDSKIEMNKKINENLEEIGKTLFKRWFVDFEYLNENGEEYKSNGGEMVFCEELEKEIPKDWRVGRLGDLVKIQSGFAFKSKDFVKFSNNRIIKIKNISGGIVNLKDSVFIDDTSIRNIDSKFIINEKDILIAMTGAEVGKIGVVQKSENKLLLNQRVGMFRQISDFGLLYSYVVFNSNEYLKKIRDKAIGSAQPNISSTDIENISLLIPNSEIISKFEKIYSNFFNNYIDNLNEIQNLQNTRDVLLPKLMRGEIRVKK